MSHINKNLKLEYVKEQWGVWCAVWGGVTGCREAWLKSNGKVVLFDYEDEAEAEAKTLNANVRSHRASFSYSARQYQ